MRATLGDVARHLHAHAAAVGPGQHAVMHLEPALHRRREHFDGFVGEAATAAGQQFVMAAGLGAEHAAVGAVGEQQLQAVVGVGRDRDGVVRAFEHRHEAFVRGGQRLADALGLGDVGHGGHPADLVAVGSSSGDTYMRAVKREPSRRWASTSRPLLGVLPDISTSSVC